METRAIRATFVHESADGHIPTVIHLAEYIFRRDAHITKKHLVEFTFPCHLPKWAHLHPLRLHINQQNRQTLVLWDIRVRAHDQLAPIAHPAVTRPHLLAVDDVVLAIQPRLCLQAGKIGAGVWFRKALAPNLFRAEDLRDKPFLLRFRSIGDNRRTDQSQTKSVGHWRSFHPRHLFPKNGLLHKRGAASSVLLWPRNSGPVALLQLPLPRSQKRK